MLAIAGGKGGCGKTTTALGLAAALARRGAEPLVADADRNGPDCHLLAGTDAEGLAGVEVVPTPPGTLPDGRFQAALDRLAARERRLERARPVLVDCPAGGGRDAVAPLRASDAAILATTLDPASLRDAAKTAAMADRLGVDLAGAVLTRVPSWARADGEGRLPDPADGPIRPETVRREIARRVERLLNAPVVGAAPAVEGFGKSVLAHPAVRASYARLARALDGGEHLSHRASNAL